MFIDENKKTNDEIIKEILNNPTLSDEAKKRAIQSLKDDSKTFAEGIEEGEVILNEDM